MELIPRFTTVKEKLLAGKKLSMSLSDDKTGLLWQSFMRNRKAIGNRINNDLICMQIYSEKDLLKDFTPQSFFDKWACTEVIDNKNLSPDMEPYTLKGGLYAVFLHTGRAADFEKTFNYIFYNWLPQSDFILDSREHFQILGDKYKNDDPSSEEEVYIPVRAKI
jgi:AraC family transcriptional regulator